MADLLTIDGLIALLTLTFLEIVLGIDNIIFISIISNRLPESQQAKARNIGLGLALLIRIGLLFGITVIIRFTEPLISILSWDFSGRDLILLVGGLFLLGKSTTEIYHKVEGKAAEHQKSGSAGMKGVIFQIILMDIIFSFDSILTAIGLTDKILIMIVAITISMIIMMAFAGRISGFIRKHPSLEILALAFLILIGFMLMLEGFHKEVPKGYIYFAVFFSLIVELLNMRLRKSKKPLSLNKRME